MTTLADSTGRMSQTDKFWLARSSLMIAPADGYYAVMRIPEKAFVSKVYLYVPIGISGGSATATIGFAGNQTTAVVDFFMSNSTAALTVPGMKASIGACMWFNADRGVITISVAANGDSMKNLQVFAEFMQIY